MFAYLIGIVLSSLILGSNPGTPPQGAVHENLKTNVDTTPKEPDLEDDPVTDMPEPTSPERPAPGLTVATFTPVPPTSTPSPVPVIPTVAKVSQSVDCVTAISQTWPAELSDKAVQLTLVESSNNPAAVNPAGYHGCFQFDLSTWKSNGCIGDIYNAIDNARCGYLLFTRRGWQPWPPAIKLNL